MDEHAAEQKPGCLMPIVWAVVAGLLVCGGVGATAFLGMGSESAGVAAANWSAGPVGFGLAGGLTAVVVHFASKNAGVRIGAPIGCGCLGAIGMVGAVFVFFTAIFPAL